MNVLIIPSWYPTKTEPFAGIFIKDQAVALADYYPEHNFIISNCENFYLSITKPKKFVNRLTQYFQSKPDKKKISKNLTELYSPALTWTSKLKGEIKNILKAHTENFESAQKEFGRIDIIHAHTAYPGGYSAMMLSLKFNVPYIVTEHMAPFPFEIYISNGKLSEKVLLPLTNGDRIIAVSNFQSSRIKSFGIKEPVVIPNLVSENEFNIPSNSDEHSKIKFLTVTTFIERKGITELLAAILKCKEKCINCEFTIAGTGPLEDYMLEFINNNSLDGVITLKKDPPREEIVNLFMECDAFILPSRLESFGIVYIEAMACGKPVIATDCGGPADFINSENGILVKTGDVDEISNAILKVAANLKSYDAAKIRKFYLENYSRKVVSSKIFSLYEDVLKNVN